MLVVVYLCGCDASIAMKLYFLGASFACGDWLCEGVTRRRNLHFVPFEVVSCILYLA